MHEILPGSTGKVARQLRRVLQSTDRLDSKREETSKDRIFAQSVRGGEETIALSTKQRRLPADTRLDGGYQWPMDMLRPENEQGNRPKDPQSQDQGLSNPRSVLGVSQLLKSQN